MKPAHHQMIGSLLHVLAVSGVALAGSDESRKIAHAERICRKGVGQLEEGRLADADSTFRRALEAYPDSWVAHEGLGLVAMKGGQYAPALAHLARAWTAFVEHQRRSTDAQVSAALELDRVRQAYDDYAIRGPNIGCGHQTPNEFDHQVELSAEVTPPPGLFFRMGVCLLHLDRAADAREAFLAELQVSPELAAPHLNLAVCELQLGQPREALVELDQAVALGANEPAGLRADILAAGDAE
jgi:tetratricopeptide (TPR) repeat protein